MCGIVGYIGNMSAQPILAGGLKRLEYRGYDSAGIVTIGDEPTLIRAKGKVAELEAKIRTHTNNDTVGIGHTRWATHGEPSEANAHPHQAGDIFLVHNGIIENYKELKAELKNHIFASETDTEVLAALVDSLYDQDSSLETAVTQALKLVDGTYGIAVVSTREPGKIVVARSGSPLIIGVGKDETLIASDASALIGHTSDAIYLNDGEVAVCTAGLVELSDLSSHPLSAKVEKIEADMSAIQKQGYDHFLLKEIMEQPVTLASTLNGRVIPAENRAQLGGLNMTAAELRQIEHVVIIGCGTAYYAGMLASYYLERLVDGLTVDVEIASELRYRSFNLPKNSVALVVSQSGETADTLACLREIKRRGVKTLGVINVVGSTIAREVDGGVYVHAGPEISVASTKAFTSQVAAMTIFGVQLAQAKGAGAQEMSEYINELAILPDEINSVLDANKDSIKDIATKYAKYDHALYLGRDTLFPTALEGALKLKEISYIHAEGYAGGELKHGPLALIDDRFFEVILLQDNWLLEKSISNLAEINARGGHVIAITSSEKEIDAETIVRVKTKLHILAPIVLNVVQQLFAYHIAVARGNDIDQPRNLAKSVTVE
ncbi:MAG: glutamine--fructose-6-phosphate transaminase (isomerizing) [Candidatus Saccharimonadales bacterium]